MPLLVILGPTAVGKTALSLGVAERLGAPIVSADSRQMFRGMEIGTAAPTKQEQQRVPHYFIGTLAPDQYYNAARYETEALTLLKKLFERHNYVVLTGGSMLYLDAVCQGIDDIPTVDDEVRRDVQQRLANNGIEALRSELRLIDPTYYAQCDLRNARRIVHALEVFYTSGHPLSAFRGQPKTPRPFRIIKIGLRRERTDLFQRINTRTEQMLAHGLIDEARRLKPFRHCNALQGVGYKEAFRYLDGEWTLNETRAKIQRNTRVYAKKQITWFQKDTAIHWLDAPTATPHDVLRILQA